MRYKNRNKISIVGRFVQKKICLITDYDRDYDPPSMRPPGELPVDALSPGVSHRAQLVLHLLVSLLSLLLPAIRRWFSRRGNGASSSSVYWTVTRPETATSFRYAGFGWMMDECDETRRAWNYFHTKRRRIQRAKKEDIIYNIYININKYI